MGVYSLYVLFIPRWLLYSTYVLGRGDVHYREGNEIMDDDVAVDITVGDNTPRATTAHSGDGVSTITRLRVLWAAIKYLFTGKGMFAVGNVRMHIGSASITSEAWIKKDDDSAWQQWAVTFDGIRPVAYVNGIRK